MSSRSVRHTIAIAIAVAVFASAQLFAQPDAASPPSADPAVAAEASSGPDPASPEADAAVSPAEASAAPGASAAAVPAKPQLVVAEPVRDLGKLQRGDRAEVEFVLENRGDAALKIKSAQPACGCTVASFDPAIEPGASGRVRALLDTETLQGAVAKSITVLTNDPATPRAILTIKAEIVTFVQVSPAFARLLLVQSLPAEPTVVRLWSGDGTPLEITEVRSPERWIETSFRRAGGDEVVAVGPPEQWRLEISLAPDAPLGPLTDKLLVRTSHPRQHEVEIPLSGFVRAVLTSTPAVADFGKLARNVPDKSRFVLKLFNFGTDPIEVHRATTDLAFVSVVTSPEEPGRRFRVELRVAPDAPKGKFEGKLRLETSSTQMPVVEIPVRGRIG